MKKQGAGAVYYGNPTKSGRRELQAPVYTVKRKPRDLYTKKVDESSDEEEQSKSKRKDAGDDSPDSKR